jgi:exodeoxyribonuclease VII small subunit
MASKGDKKDGGISAFEASTKQLEAIIKTLEDDSTTLEQALTAFEQGVKLTRSTQKSLREAEQKVQLLLEGDEGPIIKDFEEQE